MVTRAIMAYRGLTNQMAKISKTVTAAIRDGLILEASALVTMDTDSDRAWIVEQALSSYKRARVRLLQYVEGQKKENK